MKLNTVALGTSTITVSAGGYSDTVNIEVIALSNPELKLTGETTLQGVTDSEIELPVIATSCDGKDLSEYVTVDCQDGRLTYNKSNHSVSVTEKGEYTLTLTVKDPRDESKTDSETFTVNAYRKVFNAVDGYGMAGLDAVFEDGKEFVEDSEQVAYFNRSDATFAQFNMQPSKVYYAEVTLTSAVSKADWSTFFGMNHSVKGDTTKWLTSFIDRGDAEGEKGARNFRVKYSDMVEDNEWWNLNEGTSRTPIYYSYRIYQCRELNDGGDAFPVTLAVARIGDWFYSFVNGDYVNAVTNTNFENVDTVAGVYQQSAIRANYTNIKDFAGTPETARKSMAIIGVSQYSLIFPLSPNDMNDLCALYEKAGQINEIEADNIVHNERGCAFLISSPESRTNIRIVATPYFEKIFG